VADLEEADKNLKNAQVRLAMAERQLQYDEARYHNAFQDFRLDVTDPIANFTGRDREFIRWEGRRQRQQQRITALRAKIERLQAILKGDHVVIRKGMLVVATQQIVKPYRDAEEAADGIGDILVVMRVGGRHMHWGKPQAELANYQQ